MVGDTIHSHLPLYHLSSSPALLPLPTLICWSLCVLSIFLTISWLNFCLWDRLHDQKQLERKGFISVYSLVYHWGKPGQKLKVKTWRQEIKQSYGGMLLTGLLPCLTQLASLYSTDQPVQVWHFPCGLVGALLHQLSLKMPYIKAHRLTRRRQFLSWSSFFSNVTSFISIWLLHPFIQPYIQPTSTY